MGTTFVTADGDHGYWMRDGTLELWLRLLALHLPEQPLSAGVDEPVKKMRNQWLLASSGGFTGCVPVALDEACSTEVGRSAVNAALASLLARLRAAPPELDPRTLDLLGLDGPFASPVATRRLIEVAQAFRSICAGEVRDTARETRFVPGSE